MATNPLALEVRISRRSKKIARSDFSRQKRIRGKIAEDLHGDADCGSTGFLGAARDGLHYAGITPAHDGIFGRGQQGAQPDGFRIFEVAVYGVTATENHNRFLFALCSQHATLLSQPKLFRPF